jgi:hypothetical protein
MDIFDSIGNGFISGLAREVFSRLFNYTIQNKEKIIFVFKKIFKKTRDYDLSNNHPNTPFTYNGKEFVTHT